MEESYIFNLFKTIIADSSSMGADPPESIGGFKWNSRQNPRADCVVKYTGNGRSTSPQIRYGFCTIILFIPQKSQFENDTAVQAYSARRPENNLCYTVITSSKEQNETAVQKYEGFREASTG